MTHSTVSPLDKVPFTHCAVCGCTACDCLPAYARTCPVTVTMGHAVKRAAVTLHVVAVDHSLDFVLDATDLVGMSLDDVLTVCRIGGAAHWAAQAMARDGAL